MNIQAYNTKPFSKRPHLSAVSITNQKTKSTSYTIYDSKDNIITKIPVNYNSLTTTQQQDLITSISKMTHEQLGLVDQDPVILNIY